MEKKYTEVKDPFIQELKVGTKLYYGEHELDTLKTYIVLIVFSLVLYMIVEIFAV